MRDVVALSELEEGLAQPQDDDAIRDVAAGSLRSKVGIGKLASQRGSRTRRPGAVGAFAIVSAGPMRSSSRRPNTSIGAGFLKSAIDVGSRPYGKSVFNPGSPPPS
jgi:hypothetical protein